MQRYKLAAGLTVLLLLLGVAAFGPQRASAAGAQAMPTPLPTAGPTAVPSPSALPTGLPTGGPVPTATATPLPAASPTPTASPMGSPTPPPAIPATPVPAPTPFLAPAGAPLPQPLALAPDAPPQILAIQLSDPVFHSGELVSGTVITSTNVAAVQLRMGTYIIGIPRTTFGVFRMSYRMPHFSFFAYKTYHAQLVALNAAGAIAERDLTIPIR